MKKYIIPSAALAAIAAPMAVAEGNMPLIQTKYTADPAPIVRNDTIYLYTSHDEDNAEGFLMKNWLLYTSTDMKNWQDRGIPASLKDFKWYDGNNGAWAQIIGYGGNSPMHLRKEENAVTYCRMANDHLAQAVRQHPGRMYGYAVVQLVFASCCE